MTEQYGFTIPDETFRKISKRYEKALNKSIRNLKEAGFNDESIVAILQLVLLNNLVKPAKVYELSEEDFIKGLVNAFRAFKKDNVVSMGQ